MSKNNLDYCAEDPYCLREKNILKRTIYGLATVFGAAGLALALDENRQHGRYIIDGMFVLMTAVDVFAYRAMCKLDREILEEKRLLRETLTEEIR